MYDMDKLRKDFTEGDGGPEPLEEAFKGNWSANELLKGSKTWDGRE